MKPLFQKKVATHREIRPLFQPLESDEELLAELSTDEMILETLQTFRDDHLKISTMKMTDRDKDLITDLSRSIEGDDDVNYLKVIHSSVHILLIISLFQSSLLYLPRRSLPESPELFLDKFLQSIPEDTSSEVHEEEFVPPPDQMEFRQLVAEDSSSEVHDDEFVPPPEQMEFFQLVAEDSSSQGPSQVQDEFEVSPSAGGLPEKGDELSEFYLDNSQFESEIFDSSPVIEDGTVEEEVLLNSKTTDQDDNFTEREEDRMNPTSDIARKILEEVLERCELQMTVVEPVLDEIIAVALRTAAETLTKAHYQTPGSDDHNVETSQEEIFSSLSPSNTEVTPLTTVKQELLSQEDRFASQTSNLERCDLQTAIVEPVLDEIIAAALRTAAETLSPTPGSDEKGGNLDNAVETSQKEIFSSLSPRKTVTAVKQELPLSQEDMFASQTSNLSDDETPSNTDTTDHPGGLSDDKPSVSQQDMFASQTSSVDEEPAVLSALLTPISACGDERKDAGQKRKQPGKILPLVPYSPSSGESSPASDLEESDEKMTQEREDPGDDLSSFQNDLFCLNARQMNIKVQRLSASNESFLTVSSGDGCSQGSSVSSVEEIKSPIQIPVENCQSLEEEERGESSSGLPVSGEEPFQLELDVPRRICQRFKFIPDQDEGHELDRAKEDLAYKPVTSFVLRKKKKKVQKSSAVATKMKPKDTPLKYILIQNWLIENEDFVVQLEKSKELIIHAMPDQQREAHILVGPMTGIFLLNAEFLKKVSIRDVYSECSRSLRELWLLCIGSYDVYMQSTGFSYELTGREEQSVCRVFPLLVNDNIESIAHWVIQLSRKQRHEDISPHLRDGSSRHEMMLVKMFPCLNSLSAKIILSQMKLLDFLRLNSAEDLTSHFPWLSQSAVRSIQRVRSVRLSNAPGRW